MKRPAFQFYPADWRGSRWVRYDFEDNVRPFFASKPGCYAIFIDGKLAYIGQTSNVAKRMSAHGLRNSYGGGHVTCWGACRALVVKVRYATSLGDWAQREIRLIERLKPAFNCVGGGARKRGER